MEEEERNRRAKGTSAEFVPPSLSFSSLLLSLSLSSSFVYCFILLFYFIVLYYCFILLFYIIVLFYCLFFSALLKKGGGRASKGPLKKWQRC